MCGICGIMYFDKKQVTKEALGAMIRKMKHRGPDDDGMFLESNMGMGSARLSILDLSPRGHMPMISENSRYVIVYNGEVYNYIELRQELKSKYNFRSETDTEVVLCAYQEWGENCLHRFNGMFSFAIYDRKSRTYFCARDRYGIKPFYYFISEQMFIFASEISSILTVMDKHIEADDLTIFDFLIFNKSYHTENSFFKGIRKLQHAHSMNVEEGRCSLQKWYDLKSNINKQMNGPIELREELERSVKLRLRSDVPIGTCLSGGLDSSAITSIMRQTFGREELHTFSAVYGEGQIGDETYFIDMYKPFLKNMHYTSPTIESFLGDMESFVRAHTEPVESVSAYAEFKVMELARDYVTVILNGQGPDEALGGYPYFFGYLFKELFLGMNLFELSKEVLHYIQKHSSFYGIAAWMYLMAPDSFKTVSFIKKKPYYHKDFVNTYKNQSLVPQSIHNSRTLKEAFVDHYENRFEHHLIMGDRSSMWYSLELRFPFLDHNIVEGFLSMPRHYSIKNGITKCVLRDAMRGLVPDAIVSRNDKVGFETPDAVWFRSKKFSSIINDILSSKSVKERGYIDTKKAMKKYNDHLTGKCDISNEIWKWINLELWFKMFIEEKTY